MIEEIDRLGVRGETNRWYVVDRLSAQGAPIVGRITDKFRFDSKGRSIRRFYRGDRLGDVDVLPPSGNGFVPEPLHNEHEEALVPSEMPSSNGHDEQVGGATLRDYTKPHQATIEGLLPPPILDKLYGRNLFIAVGHRYSTGVMFVDYSQALRGIAGRRLAVWHRLDTALKFTPGEQDIKIAARAARVADSIERTTGFRPEELAAYKGLLSDRLRGSKSEDGPIRTLLAG